MVKNDNNETYLTDRLVDITKTDSVIKTIKLGLHWAHKYAIAHNHIEYILIALSRLVKTPYLKSLSCNNGASASFSPIPKSFVLGAKLKTTQKHE